MIRFHGDCTACLIEARLKSVLGKGDEMKRLEFAKRLCLMAAEGDAQRDSAPAMGRRMQELQREMYGFGDEAVFRKIRHEFNALLLSLYDELKARVFSMPDPLSMALRFAQAGNYIDFGVVEDVNAPELMRMLEKAAEHEVDPAEYEHLRSDLSKEGEFIVLCDNCGEIVLDKLLIEAVRYCYPGKKTLAVVREREILNDVTMDDAIEVGLTEITEVMDNGCGGLAGTEPPEMPPERRVRLENACAIVAKGMGNFETLIGSGLNVYYLFLSKCANYGRWFGFKHFEPIFANERRMRIRK